MDVRPLSARRGDEYVHGTARGSSAIAVTFNYPNDDEVYEDLEDEDHNIDAVHAAVAKQAPAASQTQRGGDTVSQLDFRAIFKHHVPKPPDPPIRLPGASLVQRSALTVKIHVPCIRAK